MRSRSLSSHLSPGALQSKCGLGTSGITGGLLEMLNLRFHLRTTESEAGPQAELPDKIQDSQLNLNFK